jgi:hypothetical protein
MAVASFYSGDPDQDVPFALYTVVLYTLTLHAGFNCALRSLLRQIHQRENISSYFASTRVCLSLFCQFRQREDFSLLVCRVQLIGYNF